MNYRIENALAVKADISAPQLPQLVPTYLAKSSCRSLNNACRVYALDLSESLIIQRHPEGQPSRKGVEAFIRNIFYQAHSAHLKCYLPELFAAKRHDQVVAAVGVRFIDQAPIFLERYLEQSVEQLLTDVIGVELERNQIAEVGNLGSLPGESRLLISFLVELLFEKGLKWAVCTGTNAVRALLKRMGIEFEVIKKAEPELLGEDRFDWGNYYQHNPLVLAIDVTKAHQRISQKYALEVFDVLRGAL